MTPAEIARTDQELACFAETLNVMIGYYPEHHPEQDRTTRVGTYAYIYAALTHHQALILLALAVERLAG
jgi:hypothetical protein